jgi:hypothetical protein
VIAQVSDSPSLTSIEIGERVGCARYDLLNRAARGPLPLKRAIQLDQLEFQRRAAAIEDESQHLTTQ